MRKIDEYVIDYAFEDACVTVANAKLVNIKMFAGGGGGGGCSHVMSLFIARKIASKKS